MPHSLKQPLATSQPVRLPGDFLGVRRISDVSGGYNRRTLEDYYGQADVPPMFWDAQNINWYERPGHFFLCSRCVLIDSLDADDKEYLTYTFKAAVYRFPTANMAAAKVQKISSAVGTPTWAALANIYPGATAIRNAVDWRDTLVIASGENLLRVMSATETWTTISAPAAVGAALAGQVGIGPDDYLLCWWESNGMYKWDGTNWTKVYPTVAGIAPADPFCDLIARGTGSTLFFTRDSSSRTTMYEYFIEPQGTGITNWFSEGGLRVWPQGADVYDDATFLVGRLGAAGNTGFFMRKEYRQAPELLDILDSTGYTAGLDNADWSFRCIKAIGDALWVGGSSREDRDACLYRYFVDESGQVIGPTAVIDGVAGPIYSIGIIPPAVSGSTGTERLHLSVVRGTYYKDADGGSDPTTDAASGHIQFPDIDYGTDDREKVGRLYQVYVSEKSTGGVIDLKYRVNPKSEEEATNPWRTAGQATVQGLASKQFPNDNAALNKYGTAFRRIQLRVDLTRATSGTVRDVIDMVLVDSAEMRPVT